MQRGAQDLLSPEIVLNSPSLLSEERSALAAEVLQDSGRLRLQVHGESMLPTIWPRAIVEIASCSVGDVKRGEIVLAMRDGRLFLHRFVAHKEHGFALQGDSMPSPDPMFQDEELIGKLTDGSIAPAYDAFAVRLVYCAIGRVFCHCGSLRRIGLKLHRRWGKWREMQVPTASQTVHLEAEC
jgi:Peptidase S24-like